MSQIDDTTLESHVLSATKLLGIPVEPEWTASIQANLKATLRLAESVAEFELPDDAEPAPVFEA
ncbi:MAG: DUF4089 domain-containing protein [Sphingomonadales bacterium]|jgi:hypothetical protein|nr:DUF4089 domain-containing protein [Sphingomonadales bacterium]